MGHGGELEKLYRFTPFAQDNRPVEGRELDIRGKCPLELAGYDIGQMPIAASCAANCWAGRLKPSGSLSQMRNAPKSQLALRT